MKSQGISLASVLRDIEKEKKAKEKEEKRKIDSLEKRKRRGKSWCKQNGITEEQMDATWNNSLKTNQFAQQLHRNGHNWQLLEPRILQQMIDRYWPKGIETTEPPSEAAAE